MKEIKFRYFDEKAQKMLQLKQFHFDNFRKKYKVMQYTGLTDKQGVEIYEGDIVNFIPMDMFGVVKVFNKSLCFGLEWVNSKTEIFTQLFYLECEQELEVIGNIYEDSHLLLETAK